MNVIEATVRPGNLSGVYNALAEVGLVGRNAIQVVVRGAYELSHRRAPRDGGYVTGLHATVKPGPGVSDADTKKAIDTVIESARTGNLGDRKILVSPVANVVRLRSGEQGEQALWVKSKQCHSTGRRERALGSDASRQPHSAAWRPETISRPRSPRSRRDPGARSADWA